MYIYITRVKIGIFVSEKNLFQPLVVFKDKSEFVKLGFFKVTC